MNKAQTHIGLRPVIAIIGNCNSGKSTLLNALTDEQISIVSDVPGTTTDAVAKSYELIPAGPVTFYDTAGLDDNSKLGKLRTEATEKIIRRADIILYVIGNNGLDGQIEEELRRMHLEGRNLIPVFNFADTYQPTKFDQAVSILYRGIYVSAKEKTGIDELKQRIIEILNSLKKDPKLISGLVHQKDTVVMVTPIDLAAPKGRLIMPQVQTLREILDKNAIAVVTKESELKEALANLKTPPALVITDSQAVKKVAEIVDNKIPLTTFSMLYARSKWDFVQLKKGLEAIKNLKQNSRILIAEGCAHRTTCDDIGRVKIPQLLNQYTGKKLNFNFCSGNDFPKNITSYDLIIHCGGCMLNKKEIEYRLKECAHKNVPITNYGMIISLTQGVLERILTPLI